MEEKNIRPEDTGIILSSRIRLARNLKDLPFPQHLKGDMAQKIVKDVTDTVMQTQTAKENSLKLLELKDLSPVERMSLVEKHTVSRDLINNYKNSAVIVSQDEKIAIMINEEDHIRIQTIYPGFHLKEAYEEASKLDDEIEDKLDLAFDSKLGYLTSCPTNVGTGIRASVMLHLPALAMTKNITNILNTVSQVGMTIRGIYGEGSNIMGNIYQISNQVTLGLSEEDIINNLIAVTTKIIDQELLARKLMYDKHPRDMEDTVYRSLGILKYSRKISTGESLKLLSSVRMGIEMGIIKEVDAEKISELVNYVQPAMLQIHENETLDSTSKRDETRAKMLREALK